MKGEWIRAERIEEVRAAAEGWKKARAAEEGTFEEISTRYPEPRVLPAPLWRALVFVFVSLALLLLLGAFAAGVHGAATQAFTFLFSFSGVACLIAT